MKYKKKVKLKDAGFSQAVLDQAPKMSRNMKVYVVKAKIGPQITSLLCDDKVFDTVPVKKEVLPDPMSELPAWRWIHTDIPVPPLFPLLPETMIEIEFSTT